MPLSYDNDGNLTQDGVLQYVYDGWNRLKKVQRKAAHAGQADDVTTLATYAYLPDHRRASKVVEHCGIEAVANDGGDTTIHFYYCGTGVSPVRWSLCETRNGSNQSTRQWVWGTRYVDEVVFMDVNGSPSYNNNCDPDVAGDGSPLKDRRYFYHQDRNWNVVALSEYADGVGTNARVTERYAYTPYGEFVVLKGDGGSGELGAVLPTSAVGNVFFHQGLPFDPETLTIQNRRRQRTPYIETFFQVDPLGYREGANSHASLGSNPLLRVDWLGLLPCCANPGCYAIYGNWCGPYYSGGLCDGCAGPPAPPIDVLDSCCEAHDGCYVHGGDNTQCNQQLCACLDAIPEDYRVAAWYTVHLLCSF
jgi:RHS repeat-associated protein